MPAKKKVAKKKAFRWPGKFSVTVTQAMFDGSAEHKANGNDPVQNVYWNVVRDCPLAVAARKKLGAAISKYICVSASDMCLTRYDKRGAHLKQYMHDGKDIVLAFDRKDDITLPRTVTFTPAKAA